jgi:hypothetical protein
MIVSEYTGVWPIFEPATSRILPAFTLRYVYGSFQNCTSGGCNELETSPYVGPERFALRIGDQSVDLQIASNPLLLTNPPSTPPLNLIYDLSQENRIKY